MFPLCLSAYFFEAPFSKKNTTERQQARQKAMLIPSQKVRLDPQNLHESVSVLTIPEVRYGWIPFWGM